MYHTTTRAPRALAPTTTHILPAPCHENAANFSAAPRCVSERGTFEEEERGRVAGRDEEPRTAERGAAALLAGELVGRRTRDLIRGRGGGSGRDQAGVCECVGMGVWASAWARAGHTWVPCPVM